MLSPRQQLEWTNALFDTFDDEEFSELLLGLDESIRRYASRSATEREAILSVVGALSRRDREHELITAAVEWRPRNAALVRLASTKGVAAAPGDDHLQRLIVDTNSLLDLSTWLENAGKVQVCVCRIEIEAEGGGTMFGTGFLIGSNRVMTNWHVVRGIVAKEDNDASYNGPKANAKDVICRFDYKRFPNGLTSKGSAFTLSRNWRIALSPNNPDTREPSTNELDCAVLELAKAVGSLPVGDLTNEARGGDARGFIQLPALTDPHYAFESKSPLFIVQHPSTKPIKLALETSAIQSVNANRTRVKYSTNTEKGSSGSPCFDQNWNLIALHHSGDPDYIEGTPPTFNQGIPIDTIVSFLEGERVI